LDFLRNKLKKLHLPMLAQIILLTLPSQ